MIRRLAPFIFLALLAPVAGAASSPPVRTDHLQSRLVAEHDAAVPGTTVALGLLLEHDPHWHTYWRNPGDSGLATELEFVLPDGVVAEPIAWPHPQRFELTEIVNYGFDGRQLLPVTITVPAGYAAASLPVRAKASWLICEEECIPGKAEYAFDLPIAASADVDAAWRDDFAAARAGQPGAAPASLTLAEDGDRIVLTLDDPDATPARWLWIPETPQLVANPAGPRWQRTATGWQAHWPKNEYFTALPPEAAFVAIDEAAGDGGSGGTPFAWRYAATAAATTGANTAEAANAAGAASPGSEAGFGRIPTSIFAFAALLFAATIAFAVRAALSRRASAHRSEESDR